MSQAVSPFWDPPIWSSAHLRLLRFVFFLLLGLDAWLQLEHAPRYGAGAFNVPHLPLPADWLPHRIVILAAFVAQTYLALAMALRPRRWIVLLLSGLFGVTYFWSQLNSYQHHYLIFLLLVILSLHSWGEHEEQPGEHSSRVLRLLQLQIALLYLWAAFAKLDAQWLSGEPLSIQISQGPMNSLISSLETLMGQGLGWKLAAASVLLLELLLGVLWALPKRRSWMLLLGVPFHLTVELSGFRIGLFSYFMLAVYLLQVPSSWLQSAESLLRAASKGLEARGAGAWVCAGVGSGLLFLIPLETGWPLALGLTLVGLSRLGSPVAHGLVCLMIFSLHLGSDSVRDYYKYWGGDTRRRGELVTATEAYRQVTQLDPGYASGFYRLGDLLARQRKFEEALEPLERAVELEPKLVEAWIRIAWIYDHLSQGEEALRSAERVLQLKPGESQAVRIQKKWARSP